MSEPGATEANVNDQSVGSEPPEDLEPAASDQMVRGLAVGPNGVTVVPANAWDGFIEHNDLRPSTVGSELEVEFEGQMFRQGKAPV